MMILSNSAYEMYGKGKLNEVEGMQLLVIVVGELSFPFELREEQITVFVFGHWRTSCDSQCWLFRLIFRLLVCF